MPEASVELLVHGLKSEMKYALPVHLECKYFLFVNKLTTRIL